MIDIEERVTKMMTDASTRIHVEKDLDSIVTDHNVHVRKSATPPRRAAVVLSAASIAAVVVAGLAVLVARDPADTPEGEPPVAQAPGGPSQTASSASPSQSSSQLLVPDETAGATITSRQILPAIPGRSVAALRSPDGTTFGLYVAENFWGAPPPDWEQRTVDGQEIFSGIEMEQRSYATLDPCVMVSIADHRLEVQAWDPLVMALLSGLTVDKGSVKVELLDGWQNLGSAPQQQEYLVSFDLVNDETGHDFVLFQITDAGAGQFLAEVHRGVPTATTRVGSPAWLIHSDSDPTYRYLLWEHDGGAALLGGRDLTDQDLMQVADGLVQGDTSQFVPTPSPDTDANAITPTTATMVPIETPTGCLARSLTVAGGESSAASDDL